MTECGELERIWKEVVVAFLKVYSNHNILCLEELRKITVKLSQDSWPLGQKSILGFSITKDSTNNSDIIFCAYYVCFIPIYMQMHIPMSVYWIHYPKSTSYSETKSQ
jgi:hypothetical protein